MEHGTGITQSVDHDGRQCGGLHHAGGRQPCWQRIVCAAARDQSSEAPFGMGSCFHRQRWIRFCSNDQQRPSVWHAGVLYTRFERFCRYSGQRPRSRDHIHAADAIGHEIMRRLTPTVEVRWDYLTVGLKSGLVDIVRTSWRKLCSCPNEVACEKYSIRRLLHLHLLLANH